MLEFNTGKAVAIGEAMIEMAPVDGGTYMRGFAGDTFNTIWHLAYLLNGNRVAGYVTKVGQDQLSDLFVAGLAEDGLDTSTIGRDPSRTMGLYLIELDGVERSFHYWRKNSAACGIADDPTWLKSALDGTSLIHLSGITVAILSPDGRRTLLEALMTARSNGARVSFDPNIRPKLWSSPQEIRSTLAEFMEVADIAVPSYDDEKTHWGDTSPEVTVSRYVEAGVAEVVVKNGSNDVLIHADGQHISIETPPVSGIRDTSGAGDAFNAGYLSARLNGEAPVEAVRKGQKVAGEVIRHFGARIPKEHLHNLT